MSIISPELFIADIKSRWSQLSPPEKKRLVEHARAYAVVFYFGEVPSKVNQNLYKLEKLNAVN